MWKEGKLSEEDLKLISSYGYPGLKAIEKIVRTLPRDWTNVRKLVRLTRLSERKVRSSLAFLVTIGSAERKRSGRIYFYRLREEDLRDAFLKSEPFFWILWSLLIHAPVRDLPWVGYAIKFAQEMGIVQLGGKILSEEGKREVLAAAIEKAYLELSHRDVSLSEISSVLSKWGLPKEKFKKLALGAVSRIKGAKILRVGKPSKDYLDLHYIVLERSDN